MVCLLKSNWLHQKCLFLLSFSVIPRRQYCNKPKMAEAPKRNIEIKARIPDENEFQRRVTVAKDLCNDNGELLKQHDIFYKVDTGRLKLRIQVRIFSKIFYAPLRRG